MIKEGTAEFYIKGLLELGVTDVSESIYEFLLHTDSEQLKSKIDELEAIKSETSTLTGSALASWKGDKSRRTGAKFEEIVQFLFAGNNVFEVQTSVRSSTSEIDLVLTLKPYAVQVSYLRSHHTIYGESKCHEKGLKKEWIDEMRTTLKDHGAHLGLIFLYCKPRKVANDARNSIALGVNENRVVIPFGKRQLLEVAGGRNLLSVLEAQFRNSITHNTELAI